jgi:hypothetical protein
MKLCYIYSKNMHNHVNYGAKIWKLPFQKPKPWLTSFEIQATSFEVAHFCESFFMKMLIDSVSYYYHN